METLEHLAALPNFEPIIEDEIHVLRTCVLYEDLRHNLSQLTKTCLFADLYRLFTEEDLIRETSKFLAKAHERRFPKKATNDEESTWWRTQQIAKTFSHVGAHLTVCFFLILCECVSELIWWTLSIWWWTLQHLLTFTFSLALLFPGFCLRWWTRTCTWFLFIYYFIQCKLFMI